MFTQCRHFYKQQVQSNANKCSSFTILLSFFTYCYTLLGDIIQYGKTMKQNHFQGFFGGGKLFYHFPLVGKKKKIFPHRFEPRTSRTRATRDNPYTRHLMCVRRIKLVKSTTPRNASEGDEGSVMSLRHRGLVRASKVPVTLLVVENSICR